MSGAGIIILVCLRESIEKRGALAGIKSLDELKQAVIEGAVHRLRPKFLTEGVGSSHSLRCFGTRASVTK